MIKLVYGSVVDQETDVIVNAANKFLAPGGGVCGAIFSRAGYFELDEACKKIKTPLNDGDAVMTPSFNIKNAKYIIHAVGPDFNQHDASIDNLYKAYYNSLCLLKENDLHSISFPLISSGIYAGSLDNPVKISTESCLRAYNDFVNTYRDYNINVLICAFSKSDYNEASKIL